MTSPSPPARAPALAQAQQLASQGKLPEARALVERALLASPDEIDLRRLATQLCYAMEAWEDAAAHARHVLRLRPTDSGMQVNLARLLGRLGQNDEAMTLYESASRLRPDLPEPYLDAASMLLGAGRNRQALEGIERALAILPANAALRGLKAHALVGLGQPEEACELSEQVWRETPAEPDMACLHALTLNYVAGISRERVRDAHRRAGRVLEQAPDMSRAWPWCTRDPERRLRLAFISPEMRRHSVAYFAEPIFRALDRSRFEVCVYHTNRATDDVTQRLRGLVDVFREVPGIMPPPLVRLLQQDKVDVAIDLAGFTNVQGVCALAARPVPVQIGFIGYPNTTGTPRVSHRFVDSHTDPPEAPFLADQFASEKLVRLDPCFLCYSPPPDTPEPQSTRTPTTQRPITFGSFNAIQKLNAPLARTWTRVLEGLAGSRLAIKATVLGDEELRHAFTAHLAAWGLPMDRVDILLPPADVSEHLRVYGSIDVALDSFPYHGTTTTCEALWMGVPVVSLAGLAHASRVGVSLLSCVGLTDLIAHSEDEYVSKAIALALDAPRRDDLRRTLRERMRASPLCDQRAYAQRFGDAVRACWRDFCASGK
jgi:predicted O-linked N-acetylglucosamine transferase (SPINDLY family)